MTVQLIEAAREPWIAPAPHSEVESLINVACAAAGFSPRVVHEVNGWQSAVTLVEYGLGVCLLPRLAMIGNASGIVRIPIEGNPAPTRHIVTCVRKGSRRSPAMAAVLDALQSTAREYGERS